MVEFCEVARVWIVISGDARAPPLKGRVNALILCEWRVLGQVQYENRFFLVCATKLRYRLKNHKYVTFMYLSGSSFGPQ